MAKRKYIGALFYPNQVPYDLGVGIQRGRIENKQENLNKLIELMKLHRSDFTDDEWNNFNFDNAFSVQQFINGELARLDNKYNRNYGRIQEDGIVGNQTVEALDYVLNNRRSKDRMSNPDDPDVTYGQHAFGFIGGDKNGLRIRTEPILPSPVLPSPVLKVPIKPYGLLQKKDYYGQFTNFATMRDYVMKDPTSNFARLATDYLKSKNLTWDSSPVEIERKLNISGNYHRGRGGDLYDIGQILNTFAGEQDKINGFAPSFSKTPENIIRNYQAKGPHMSLDNYNAMLQDLTKSGYANFVPKSTSNSEPLLFNDRPFSSPYLNSLYLNSKTINTITSGSWNRPWSSYVDNSLLSENSSLSGGVPLITLSMVDQALKNLFKPKHKFGGKMTQKYQAGGAAPQGDPQQQLIQLVQAAMSGDQQASAQIQLIMQAAQQGDQQAAQLAEMIMQIANQMQGGAPQSARNGAKLNYIKRLKGECPEGYEMTYFKAGGKVCKKCQKKVEKACSGVKTAKCGTRFHKTGGVMESILSEMFAKGGAMNRNKHTAFGEEKGANVVSTNHAGRWGGRRAFNERGTHNLNPHDKPNKFTAFGDEGKKKPTNVGLVGHKATGKTGKMQNRQKAGTTYKATAFGGEKQKRFHRGAKASSIGRIGSISGYPKGQWGKSGIGRI